MKPTIGRVVLYYPTRSEVDHEHSQPFPALVAHVHDEEGTKIAIGGFDDCGEPFGYRSVDFIDGTGCEPGQACWMAYQKEQEAKVPLNVPAGMMTAALTETGTKEQAVGAAKADSTEGKPLAKK